MMIEAIGAMGCYEIYRTSILQYLTAKQVVMITETSSITLRPRLLNPEASLYLSASVCYVSKVQYVMLSNCCHFTLHFPFNLEYSHI